MNLFVGICMAIAAICLLTVAYIAIITKKRTGHYPSVLESNESDLMLPTALIFRCCLFGMVSNRLMAWLLPGVDITLCIVALVVVARRLQCCFMPDWNWRWAWWQSCSLLYLFWAALLLIMHVKASNNGLQWAVGGFISCFVTPYAVRYLGTEESMQQPEEKKSLIILP